MVFTAFNTALKKRSRRGAAEETAESRAFLDYMRTLRDARLRPEIEAEQARLRPVFKAAAHVLGPHAASPAEAAVVTADGLSHVFGAMARAGRVLFLNVPAILSNGTIESLEGRHWDGPLRRAWRNLCQYEIRFNRYEPGKNRIMMNVGRFGFLTMQRGYNTRLESTIVAPYVLLPSAFMKKVQENKGEKLLDAMTRLSGLTNHDWFHGVTLTAINHNIAPVSWHAPIKAEIRDLKAAGRGTLDNERICRLGHNEVRGYKKLLFLKNETIEPFESWAMRLQREVLTRMADEPGNALAAVVDDYLSAWDDFASRTNDKTWIEGVGLTHAVFAMRFLAFNLVRAVPRDHALVQKAIAVDTTGKAAAQFDDIYNGLWARYALFGPGPGAHMMKKDKFSVPPEYMCADAGEYTDTVLSASVDAVMKSHEDSRDALFAAGLSQRRFFNAKRWPVTVPDALAPAR